MNNINITTAALAYIQEEVRRQGHDVTAPNDGLIRILWMADAWRWADEMRNGIAGRLMPTVNDIKVIGSMVERDYNARGFRRVNVRISGNPTARFADYDDVERLVTNLVDNGIDLDPLDWYKEFESIHPFRDGNGRTGKVLLAWLTDMFHAPSFPPHDLFGGWVANP